MGIRKGERAIDNPASFGVYAHIPFCSNKCPYCDFNSITAPILPEEEYALCLERELSLSLGHSPFSFRPIHSLYFGGGTPSLAAPSLIGKVLKSAAPHLERAKTEITVEANPESITPEKLLAYLSSGVNRLSIGVQSFDNFELDRIGRIHTAERAEEAVLEALDAGFTNIGIDLIFGLPGQTIKGWKKTLFKAIGLKPKHVSVYGLTLEPGTPFYSLYALGRGLPTEDEWVELYLTAKRMLEHAGYEHYEISNYALPGFESVHNTAYWIGADYLGIGAGAHSYSRTPGWGARSWNEKDPSEYMRRISSGVEATESREDLTKAEAMVDALSTGLRLLKKGVDGEKFFERFGVETKDAFGARFKELELSGLLESRGGDIILTDKGALLSNEVFLAISP